MTVTACLVVIAVLAVMAIRHVMVDIPAEVMRRAAATAQESAAGIAADVAKAFQVQPEVRVDSRVFVNQESPVAKFVVLEQTVTESYRLQHSWLRSEKTFEVQGDFTIRAGFDLAKPFVVRMNETGDALAVELPPAEILGAELTHLEIKTDEDGIWNKLTAEDRDRAINALRQQALARANADDLRQRARLTAEKGLEELLTQPGRSVTFDRAGK